MFTEPDTWSGGSIELLVALGPPSVQLRVNVGRAVWQWPALQGPYADRSAEPGNQATIAPTVEGRHYGVAILPDGTSHVAFATCFVEDSDGLWLYAGVPLGSLGTVYPVGAFPFGAPNTEVWERTVYEWLFGLARHLFAVVPFERAVIGWLTTQEVEDLAQSVVPARRNHAYVVATHEGLQYHAPNLKWAPLT